MIYDTFAGALDTIFRNEPPAALGLAVSGGGDSMALLHLAARWAGPVGVDLHVVTVDHGLRDGSAQEATMVAAQAAILGLSHDTVRWTGWDGQGNLQSAARDARRRLIADWAESYEIDHVATGHTLDDQAETVLLRMARGSGVDGLAGMDPVTVDALGWLRPLLGLRRADLRDWLREEDIGWIDDPSNDDPRFGRVRARAMQGQLADLGLTPERLASLADHMRSARRVLRHDTRALADRIVSRNGGDLLIDKAGFDAAMTELQDRLLSAAVMWITSARYRPRYDALARYRCREAADTLAGCLMRDEGAVLRLCREYNAVRALRSPTDAPWDTRWTVAGPHAPDLHIAALGPEGLRQCPDWRAAGRPQASLHSTPAIWRGDTLIAAPLAGFAEGWTATLAKPRDDFAAMLLSH